LLRVLLPPLALLLPPLLLSHSSPSLWRAFPDAVFRLKPATLCPAWHCIMSGAEMGPASGETQQLEELHGARGSVATVVATPAGAATSGGAFSVADGACPCSASRSNSKSSNRISSDVSVASTEVVRVPDKERASLSSRVQRLRESPHRAQRKQAKTAPQTAPQPAPPSPVNSDAAVAASSFGRSVGAAVPLLSVGGSRVAAAPNDGEHGPTGLGYGGGRRCGKCQREECRACHVAPRSQGGRTRPQLRS